MVSSANTAGGHELVIGLVGAIGVDLDRIADQLKSALKLVNYETRDVDKWPEWRRSEEAKSWRRRTEEQREQLNQERAKAAIVEKAKV